MGDITKNLSRREYACSCCGLADPHPRLVFATQDIVDTTGAEAVIVTSGTRCDSHNAEVSLVDFSFHEPQPEFGDYSLAGDYIFKGPLLWEVISAACRHPEFANGGIGVYLDNRPGGVDRIHLDIRGSLARWGYVEGVKSSWVKACNEAHRRKV